MNLLSRNWSQIKYSEEIFAIGHIVKPGEKNKRGFISKSKNQIVDGGTGFSCQMAINNLKDVFVFDQYQVKWFKWSYVLDTFLKLNYIPNISNNNFAGIGTREINENGIKSIEDLYKKTFKI